MEASTGTIERMFALVAIAGKQYKVTEGTILVVDRLPEKVGETIELKHVLLLSDEKGTKVGSPLVKGVAVVAKVLSQEKGDKIDVRRFKSKVRYRKTVGFRPSLTKLEILSIG